MRLKVTNVTDTKYKLLVTADQEFMDKAKAVVLKRLAAGQVKLPGFREGKAPLNLVEKNINPNVLQQEFLQEAVNHLYVQVVKAEGLRPIANPQINIKKFVPFTALEFEAEVEAVSPIKLANYKNIKMERPKVAISSKEIEGVLDGLLQRMAERKEVDRPAKTGDELVIDFEGEDSKKQPIKGASGKDQLIVIGSNNFIPGFEPNLVGLQVGKNKTFKVTFPKDYQVKSLQNKAATFSVTVKKVSEVTQAKADDNFAAKVGPFKTLVELKADIKKQLSLERQSESDREFENKLVAQIAAKSQLSVPESLIDEQVEHNEKNERQNLVYRGQTWQEHLDEEGVTEEQHRKRNRPEAEASVKGALVLSEIAKAEKIAVSPEEVELRIQVLKGQYTDAEMQSELDKPENRQDIENRLLTEKTLAKLADYAAK